MPESARPIGWPALLGAALIAGLGVWLRQSEPPLDGFTEQELFTQVGAAAFGLLALVCALGTTGSLLEVALFWRRPARSETGARWALSDADAYRLRRAGIWALGWGLVALVQTPFAGANGLGVPVRYALADPGSFLAATQTTPTWLFTALAALGLGAACLFARSWPAALAGTGVALALSLPTVVTAQVSVGRDHDLATDAAIIGTPALALLLGTLWAYLRRGDDDPAAARRVRRIVIIAGLVALACRVGVLIFELAGTAPWQSRYGMVALGLVALLAVLVIIGWRPTLTRARAALGIGTLVLGAQVALLALFPPRFRVPQSPQDNYLGYEVPTGPALPDLLTPGRPNLLLASVAAFAIVAYLIGYARLRRRGDAWPLVRPISWTAGWLIVGFLATSQVWQYGSTSFRYHMIVHMTLNVIAPVLLVLGGPLTLCLRLWRPAAAGALGSPRDAAESIMGWRVLHVLAHPLLVWLLFVGSFYLIYFSSLFELGMRFHWAHQLMTFHFLLVGFWFYAVVIGVDQPPRSLPHIARLGYVFAAMPFHAFYAVIVMGASVLIGANYFLSLELAWAPDLATDQEVGGQIAWAIGEIPLLAVVIILLAQWFRTDRREARRRDRAMDAGHDDAYQEYQKMLAALAEQDARTDQRGGS